jgi:hypothetical protein
MSAFHVEELIGTVVRDGSGRKLGRIFEMIAEERDGELVIVEYHLGKGAFLERVSMSLRNMFGMKQKEPVRVSWDRLDLSDLAKPVVTAPPAPSSRS